MWRPSAVASETDNKRAPCSFVWLEKNKARGRFQRVEGTNNKKARFTRLCDLRRVKRARPSTPWVETNQQERAPPVYVA